MRKQPVGARNDWDFDREPGERVYQPRADLEAAYIYDLIESRGRNKRAAGELTPRLVKKNGSPRLAVMDDAGTWWWLD